MYKILILVSLFLISCVSHQPQKKQESICIDTFFISLSKTPNPNSVVFIIKTDDSLRQTFKQKNWDSITFTGGIFDTINYNAYNLVDFKKGRLIEPIWTEKNPEDYFIAFRTGRFSSFSQAQVDSIVSLTLPKVEITIGAYRKIWKIRKCE